MNNKYYLDMPRRNGITQLKLWVRTVAGNAGTFQRIDEIHRKGYYNEGDRIFLNQIRNQYQKRDKSLLTNK